jgi:hypothetical protein
MHHGDSEVAWLEDDVGMNRDQVALTQGMLERQLLMGEVAGVLLHAALECVEAGGEVRAVVLARRRDEPRICSAAFSDEASWRT